MFRKIYLFLFFILFLCSVNLYAEGDTEIIINARTNQEFIIDKTSNSSFENVINNSLENDTFIVNNINAYNLIMYYCSINNSEFITDNQIELHRKGAKISYNGLQYKYYLQYDNSWNFLNRFNEIIKREN